MPIDLSHWKLTLPVAGSGGNAAEVKQPALGSFEHVKWFRRLSDGTLAFAAPVTGVTTSGSKYPRCELREMKAGGRDEASWSSTDGKTHTLRVVEAFTRLPNDKPHLVGAQIHDGKNDQSVFRLEGAKLWVTQGNDKHTLVTDTYQLGTRFEAKFVVSDGVIRAFYNDRLVATIPARFTGGFFKAGAYTQANTTNSKPSSETNYGETVIYELEVEHSDQPAGSPDPVPSPIPVPAPTPVEDDMTDADRQMLTEVRDLLRWMWSQFAGQDAAPFAFTGWPSRDGGSGKALTLVDYGRQADVQLEEVKRRLAAIESKLA